MKTIMVLLFSIVLGLKCFSDETNTREPEWYSFNVDVEKSADAFQMKFPYKYIIDKKSSLSGGIVDFPGFESRTEKEEITESGFGTLRVSSPDGSVQITAGNFISVGEEFNELGFSTVREVILTYIETPWLASITKTKNHEIIRYQSKDKLDIVLYYVPYNVKFSSRVPCRLLYIRFKELSVIENHQAEVEKIIQNFIPFPE